MSSISGSEYDVVLDEQVIVILKYPVTVLKPKVDVQWLWMIYIWLQALAKVLSKCHASSIKGNSTERDISYFFPK